MVKKWQASELEQLLQQSRRKPSFESGRKLFQAALCVSRHRMGAEGGVVGPDLTSVGRRFNQSDLLTSIVEPSKVVASQYRGVRVETINGRVHSGRLISAGDFRSTDLRIISDSLYPNKVTIVRKQDIEQVTETADSPMPTGLLDRFSEREIQDLLAYLRSGGDPNHLLFKSN